MTPCWSGRAAGRVISTYPGKSENPMFRARIVFSKFVGKRAKDASNPYEDVFIDCVAFGQTAENMAKRVDKGCILLCEGEPQVGRSFQNRDGQTVTPQELVVETWQVLSKPVAKSEAPAADASTPANGPAAAEPPAEDELFL